MTGVVLWIALALAIALILSGLYDLVRDRYAALTHFGERFVREFDRPLVRFRPSEPVVEARLRVRPFRAEVHVMLAPHDGRVYPNLVDHKQNVEYDVDRVLRVLQTQADLRVGRYQRFEEQRFACGPLYAQGRWVVVPLHLQVNPKQAGGT